MKDDTGVISAALTMIRIRVPKASKVNKFEVDQSKDRFLKN